jgi:DNA-binding NarL/FixJ family response regulator
MGNPIQVLVIQKKELVRTGLSALLRKRKEVKICGEAGTVGAALSIVRKTKPDVVIMDVRAMTEDGIDAPKTVRSVCPSTRILMLVDDDEGEVFAALASEADGYCFREAPFQRLLNAVITAASGEFSLDSTIARKVVKALLDTMAILATESSDEPENNDSDEVSFSPRELEVLSLVSQGLSNQKIADQLSISAETVKSHIRKIMKKLVVTDRTQAAVKALKRGLI